MAGTKKTICGWLYILAERVKSFVKKFKKALYNETGKKVSGMKLLKKKKGGGGCK